MKTILIIMLAIASAYVIAEVKIPENFPAQKCEGLEKALKSFAADLTNLAKKESISSFMKSKANVNTDKKHI